MKNRIKQAIYLRGSADFTSVAEYQALIDAQVAKLNQQCQTKYEQEKEHLQPLPKYRTPDYEVLTAKVSKRSTIDVRCILYTVPSRLIGRQLELHLYHDRIVGYLERHPVVELPRKRVSGKGKRRDRCINYRHVIGSMRLKPRALSIAPGNQTYFPILNTAKFGNSSKLNLTWSRLPKSSLKVSILLQFKIKSRP
ncbi:Mu transposase domain-containing protein [Acaryochloris sp. CCMEE 5410]|uniref:Mu transposase domain-containing protein n=1 Tax=Acaryochloris sp. CCMEE 5410 TaxID=310037 RepID=UPI0021D252CB|nr:hypothetical protein [Acaryochloris sp. CCMEE 5410]KAI9129404.1 hypothetical protein ON05_035395 [Acaryochloris sp. CCMEE 5410]